MLLNFSRGKKIGHLLFGKAVYISGMDGKHLFVLWKVKQLSYTVCISSVYLDICLTFNLIHLLFNCQESQNNASLSSSSTILTAHVYIQYTFSHSTLMNTVSQLYSLSNNTAFIHRETYVHSLSTASEFLSPEIQWAQGTGSAANTFSPKKN